MIGGGQSAYRDGAVVRRPFPNFDATFHPLKGHNEKTIANFHRCCDESIGIMRAALSYLGRR